MRKKIQLFCLLFVPTLLTAYAPLIPKGSADVTLSATSFDTDRIYERKGNIIDTHNDFRWTEISLLVEAGISKKDNLWARLPVSDIHDDYDGNETDFADVEIGWKHALKEWDDAILTGELIAVTPFDSTYKYDLRYGRWGVEAALSYAETFFPFGYKTTFDGKLGYRWYQGFPSDQIRSELGAWIDFSCHWQLLLQTAAECGIEKQNYHVRSFYFYNGVYRVWKGRIELNYYVNNRVMITAGYMHHFMGKYIAAGGQWIGRVTMCF